MAKLTHIDRGGSARMVDVSEKAATERVAVAAGFVRMSAATLALVLSGEAKKGDVLGAARIAGIMAAKKTPELIPLCHPLGISGVDVSAEVTDAGVEIAATVRTTDRTGVEMEALTAVAVAGLALIDMVKAVDPAAVITDVRVEEKSGGRTGTWRRP